MADCQEESPRDPLAGYGYSSWEADSLLSWQGSSEGGSSPSGMVSLKPLRHQSEVPYAGAKATSTSVKSVNDAPINRKAASDNRLPPVGGPSRGRSVTSDDWPVAGFVTRPCASAMTSGVFSHSPGSDAAPKDTTVRPRTCPPPVAGAVAAARCSGVVVSNASTVAAFAGGATAVVAGGRVLSPTGGAVCTKGSAGAPVSAGARLNPMRSDRSVTVAQAERAALTVSRQRMRIMTQDYSRRIKAAIAEMRLAWGQTAAYL